MQTRILNPNTDPQAIEAAAAVLKGGGLAVIPTETVYGLAANALDAAAVAQIYVAKGRPSDNPLIVHIAEIEEIYPLVTAVPAKAKQLADAFWPGPLTIILPKSDKIPAVTSGGLHTVAIRMPSHPVARAVIKAAGVPLAAPSANISGFPSPSKPEYAADDMTGRVPVILDGGDCAVGVESTVITLATETPTILRPGGITPEQIAAVIGEVCVDKAVLQPLESGSVAASPGMKYKHYSPKTRVQVYKGSPKGYLRYLRDHKADGVFALCFEETAAQCPVPCITMGKKAEPLTQTQRLFDALRELDEAGAVTAIAECPSASGVGLAVCNRLFRAAGFDFIKEAPVIGLTGQTGAGKSAVAALLAQRGFAVIDCDKLAREITEKGSPVLQTLADAFGGDILTADGALNRALLAERAFADTEKTKLLNAITHPAILARARQLAFAAGSRNIPAVIDAALLFQSGADADCDFTIAVTAPAELRKARIMARDGISAAAADARIRAQEPEAYYTARADMILLNGQDAELQALTASVIKQIGESYEITENIET
ncbi:MAG: threonylcarbamoyl-AMP synthase [Clostridia bacterium]|nr:threonylcarbamoyl-AMP synthase [Clostridia bacterium]